MNHFYTFLLIPPALSFAGASLLNWAFKDKFIGISRRRYNLILIVLATLIYFTSLMGFLLLFPIQA